MRTVICALFLVALSAGAAVAKVVVTPTPQQIAEYEAADEASRVKLLIMLAQTGQHELAAVLLKSYPLTGNFAKNRTLFIEGLVLYGRGNLTGATKKYREALANDPSLTLVRAELAKTLSELGENESAKHHLELLMAEAPNQAEAQGIRSFIDTIDARRPYTFNAFISVAPSTNVNNGSTLDTVYTPNGDQITIDQDSQKKSGIGFSTGGSAGYAKRLGNDFSLVFGGNAIGIIYTDSTFNTYGSSETAELRYLLQGGHLGLGAVASQSIESDISGFTYYSYGPRVSLQKDLTPKDRINLSAVYEWRNDPKNSFNDGTALLVDGSWNHALSSSYVVSFSGGYDRVNYGLDYNSYNSYSAGFGVYKELTHGITADVRGKIARADFDEVFPFYGVVRKDMRYSGSIALTKRDFNIWGYAPAVEYDYVFNDSNIASYHYNSQTVNFRLSKDF